jgi:hypothetical protein
MCDDLLNCRSEVPLALLLITVAMTTTGCARRVVSVDEVDKMIQNQVPIGSDKQKVKDFIDDLKVDSLKIVRGDFYKTRLRPTGAWDEEKIAALWDRVEEFINARIVDAESGYLNRNDIFIGFAIGKDGLMIGYTVKMLGTE